MTTSLKLAWRNVWRNRRRTLITATAVAFAAAILVFFIGLQLSSYESAISATTGIFQGHAQIQSQGYLSKAKIRNSISAITKLRQAVEQEELILSAAARAVGFALLSSEDRSYGAQITGVEPEKEKTLSSIPGQIKEGKYLEAIDANSIVIGRTMARNLHVKLGDEIVLMGQGRDGSLAVGVLKLSGIFESGSSELDRSLVEVPLRTFQELFSMSEAGHMIVLKTADVKEVKKNIATLSDIIRAHQDNLLVHSWEELSPGLKQSIEMDMASGWLFYLSLVVIVTFSVLNTFLMSLIERTREFGVLLALGVEAMQITKMVLVESFIMLLTGLVPGMLLGAAVLSYFSVYGFFIPGSKELLEIWNLPGGIYPEISMEALFVGPGIIMFFSILAVLWPAYKIKRLEAVEAMRAV